MDVTKRYRSLYPNSSRVVQRSYVPFIIVGENDFEIVKLFGEHTIYKYNNVFFMSTNPELPYIKLDSCDVPFLSSANTCDKLPTVCKAKYVEKITGNGCGMILHFKN